jgi:neutral trehalase
LASRNQLGSVGADGTVTFSQEAQAAINGTTASYEALAAAEQRVITVTQEESKAQQRTAQDLRNVTDATANLVQHSEEQRVSFNGTSKALYDTAKAAEKTSSSFELMKSRILMLLSATSIFNLLKRQVKETYEDVKQLDKSFASIAMVTKYSVNEMWSSYSQYADMASDLGQKTNDIIKASALFYQQGLDTNDALALTTNTMKLATLAGNDFETATQEMTSAIRGFKMEMDEGGRVTDVYSNLAAHAAASVDDIA